MAFKAGAIYGEADLNTKKWDGGLKRITKGTANAMKIVSGVFVAGMTASIVAANDFQKSMSNVSTIVDETTVSTQDLTKQLLRLDPALGNTTELTDALYQTFSAGADTATEAMETTIVSAKFAKAALTETATAVDVLTTATNAYGKENVTTAQASDIFFTTIKEGKITGDQLATSIGQSIPLFASSGIAIEELGAGLGAMTKQGVSANEATTQLNAIVLSFLKPTTELSGAIEELGYNSGSAFLEAEGLAGGLKLLETQTRGDAAEMARLVPNIRAIRGAMALTGKGGEEFTEILGEMENATGATDEAFGKQEKTFETFTASANKVAIVTGNIGKHFVDQLAVGATTATESMLGFLLSSEGMDIVSKIVATVAGSFEVLKTAVQPIVDVIGPAITDIFGQIGETTEELTGKGTKQAGAFKIIAAASKTVGIAITIVSKSISIAIDWFGNLTQVIMKSAGVVGGFFEAMVGNITWDEFGERVDATGDAFETLTTGVAFGVTDMIDTVKKEFETFGDETDKLAETMEVKFKVAFKETTDSVVSNWGEMTTGQKDFIDQFNIGMDQIDLTTKETNEDIVEDTEKTTKKLLETWEDYTDLTIKSFSNLSSGIFDVMAQSATNEQAIIDKKSAEQLAKLDEQRANEVITEEEYNSKKAGIEAKALAESNKVAEGAFNADKANRISESWMNAFSSIMGWWEIAPSLGPIAGPIFGGVMTAASVGLATTQTAKIAQQTFVPAYEKGGTTYGGLAKLNESGGEIQVLPDGTQIIPNDISRQIANNIKQESAPVINVSFSGAVIKDDMSLEKIANKVAKILGKQMRLVS